MNQKGLASPIIFIVFIIMLLAGLYIYKNNTSSEMAPKTEGLPTPTPTLIPSPSVAVFEPVENGFKKYKTTEYQITFPEAWISQPPISSMPGYQFFANEEIKDGSGGSFYQPGRVSLSITSYEISPTEDNWIRNNLSNPVGTVDDGVKFTTTKQANLDINGLKAVKVFLSTDGKPVDSYYETYFWIQVDDKKYYELKFLYEKEDKGKFDKIMDEIAQSFRIAN